MRTLTRDEVRAELDGILQRKGLTTTFGEDSALREIGFRSLDFSELALRVEAAVDRELNFTAAMLRRVERVRDVLDFFDQAQVAP